MNYNQNPNTGSHWTRDKIKFKHLLRISQYICAVTYVEVHKNCPKFRSTNNGRQVCDCKLQVFVSLPAKC